MKKYFITGLAILLPIAVTFWIVGLLINLLTNPFLGLVESFFSKYDLENKQFLFLNGEDVLDLTSRLLVLACLFAVLIIVGFFVRHFFFNQVFRLGDYVIHRIPLINKVYKAAQDVTKTLFDEEKTSFSQVVLVPFPQTMSYSFGFITADKTESERTLPGMVSIFVPGTPNPTMGFMLLFKKEQVIYLDIQVEEALKFIVSCGVIAPESAFKKLSG